MDFITHYYKKFLHRSFRYITLGLLSISLLSGIVVSSVYADGITIRDAEIKLINDHYYLNSDVDYNMGNSLIDAMNRGISLNFLVDLTIIKPQKYWFDEIVFNNQYNIKLYYNILTQHYTLSMNRHYQKFINLKDALRSLKQIRDWIILDANSKSILNKGVPYQGIMSIKLDTTQFPKALQVSSYSNRDFNLSSNEYMFKIILN